MFGSAENTRDGYLVCLLVASFLKGRNEKSWAQRQMTKNGLSDKEIEDEY